MFDPIKYKNDYQKEKYDRIIVSAPKGQKEVIKEAAATQGQSVNAYILQAIRARMEAEAADQEAQD